MQALSEIEKCQTAREIAADKYENGSNFGPQREAFRAGWDAALGYAAQEIGEGIKRFI